eukprot:2444841-Amphidinium_carterae.1
MWSYTLGAVPLQARTAVFEGACLYRGILLQGQHWCTNPEGVLMQLRWVTDVGCETARPH